MQCLFYVNVITFARIATYLSEIKHQNSAQYTDVKNGAEVTKRERRLVVLLIAGAAAVVTPTGRRCGLQVHLRFVHSTLQAKKSTNKSRSQIKQRLLSGTISHR